MIGEQDIREAVEISLGLAPGLEAAGLQIFDLVDAWQAGFLSRDERLNRRLRRLRWLHEALGDDDALAIEALEWWNAMKTAPAARDYIAARCGIDYATVADRFVGVARVHPSRHGFFEFGDFDAREGQPVLTVPVWGADDAGAGLVDIVAVPLVAGDAGRRGLADRRAEQRWRLRGAAAVLASDEVVFGRDGWPRAGRRLRLFSHVAGWLAEGCPAGGYVVLDWSSADARDLLGLVDAGRLRVVVDDDLAAQNLKSMARPRRPAMRVEVAA